MGATVMMVGEVAQPARVRQDLLATSVPVMDIGITVPVGTFPWLGMAPLSRLSLRIPGINLKLYMGCPSIMEEIFMVEIDWDQPGEILSPGCPHHPCLSIPGTRRLPVLSPIKKCGWWNKNGCCHLYCGSGHFNNITIIVNGSNMTTFHWN